MGIWSRLFVDTLPEAAPVSALGPKTVNQQREELCQLASLSIEPLVSEEGEPSAPPTMAPSCRRHGRGQPLGRAHRSPSRLATVQG